MHVYKVKHNLFFEGNDEIAAFDDTLAVIAPTGEEAVRLAHQKQVSYVHEWTDEDASPPKVHRDAVVKAELESVEIVFRNIDIVAAES